MGQDDGLSRYTDRDMTQEGECRTCAMVQRLMDDDPRGRSASVSVDIDQDVLVISGPELQGLVVVPRHHVGSLDELSDPDRARVLAALRHATRSVLERNSGSATTVVATTDPPASEGHVCFRVQPATRGTRGASPPHLV